VVGILVVEMSIDADVGVNNVGAGEDEDVSVDGGQLASALHADEPNAAAAAHNESADVVVLPCRAEGH
jgi:hypothetical protein